MESGVTPTKPRPTCVLCGERGGVLKQISMQLAGTATAFVSGHEGCVIEARGVLHAMPDTERREAERELLSRFW